MKAKINNIVVNTTAQARKEGVLGQFPISVDPGTIEAAERRGQEQFVASDTLPTKIEDPYDCERGSGRKILAAWGFTFGKPIGNDTLFTQARLPPGWTKRGSSHDMWSYILDEQGRERCAIFYKAAYYDREAFLNLRSRYCIEREYESEALRSKGRMRGVVKDVSGKVLFVGGWRGSTTGQDDWAAYDQVTKDAKDWFAVNLPADFVEQWAQP